MLACRAKEDKEVPYKMKKTKKDVNRNEKKKVVTIIRKPKSSRKRFTIKDSLRILHEHVKD